MGSSIWKPPDFTSAFLPEFLLGLGVLFWGQGSKTTPIDGALRTPGTMCIQRESDMMICFFTGFGYCKSPTIPLCCRIRGAGWDGNPNKHWGWWCPSFPFRPDTAMQRATGCPLPSMAGATVPIYGRTGTSPSLREDRKSRGCPWGPSSRGPVLGWPVAQLCKAFAGSRHSTGRAPGLAGRGWGVVGREGAVC